MAFAVSQRRLYFSSDGIASVDLDWGTTRNVAGLGELAPGNGHTRTSVAHHLSQNEATGGFAALVTGPAGHELVWLGADGKRETTHPVIPSWFAAVSHERGLFLPPPYNADGLSLTHRSGKPGPKLARVSNGPLPHPTRLVHAEFHPRRPLVAIGTRGGLLVWDFDAGNARWVDDCTAKPTWRGASDEIVYMADAVEVRTVDALRTDATPRTLVRVAEVDPTSARKMAAFRLRSGWQPPASSPDGRHVCAALFRPGSKDELYRGQPVGLAIVDLDDGVVDHVRKDACNTVWIGEAALPLAEELSDGDQAIA